MQSKRIKSLGINLPNRAKDLYSVNCKILWKEIKKKTHRFKNIYDTRFEKSIMSK